MFRIYLAVAYKKLEDFLISNKKLIETKINDEVDFVGTAVYREGILQGIKEYYPDVVLIREGIPGSLNLSDLVYQIKIVSPSTRIIFIAGDRKPGDAFLATLVQYGVYDILIGSKVNAKDMVKKIIYPNKMADVIEFMPKIRITESNKQLYEAPDIGLLKPMLEDSLNTVDLKPLDDIENIQEKEIESVQEELIEEKEGEDSLNEKEPSVEEKIPIPNIKTTKKLFSKKEKEPELVISEKIEELQPTEKIEPIKVLPISEETIVTESKSDVSLNQDGDVTETIIAPIQEIPSIPLQSDILQKNSDSPEIELNVQKTEQTNPFVQRGNVPLQDIKTIYQDSYMNSNMFTPRVNISQDSESTKKGLFGKKTPSKTVAQQIVTFCGGRHGCGNSQIAFNIALQLAEMGYKTLYMDLNENSSSMDAVFEFGFEDLGVDTMLHDISLGNYPNIINAISSAPKILNNVEKGNNLYRIFSKFPSKLEMCCFSMKVMYKKAEKNYDINLLKELNMFLLMNMNYDIIIMDVPSDFYNEITKISMIYSNRLIFTITQDVADVDAFMRGMRSAQIANIGYREKSNVVCNKYMSHTENDIMGIKNQIENYLRIENLTLLTVPNVAMDVINASVSQTPLLWKAKDKNFKKCIQGIANLILS